MFTVVGDYEDARERIARFINAPSDKQVIFTDGTTEGINLVAYAWGRANLGPGDEVLTVANAGVPPVAAIRAGWPVELTLAGSQ